MLYLIFSGIIVIGSFESSANLHSIYAKTSRISVSQHVFLDRRPSERQAESLSDRRQGQLSFRCRLQGVTSCNDRPQRYTGSPILLVKKLYGPGGSETLIIIQEQASWARISPHHSNQLDQGASGASRLFHQEGKDTKAHRTLHYGET